MTACWEEGQKIQKHPLLAASARGSTYMALAFLVRGSASIADVNRGGLSRKAGVGGV